MARLRLDQARRGEEDLARDAQVQRARFRTALDFDTALSFDTALGFNTAPGRAPNPWRP